MALDRIVLTDFRNHRETQLDPCAKFNLLVGENGAGKTNVLEALSLLSPGRGLRRARLEDMARAGSGAGFAVSAVLGGDGGEEPVRLGTGVHPERPGSRTVSVNGAKVPAIRLAEWLSVGWLTPAMDRLFVEGATGRRRFLDRMILARQPGHARAVTRLENALRERNRLLGGDARPEPAWLEALEVQMAEAGAAVSEARERMIADLSDTLAALPDAPFARPALAYEPGGPSDAASLASELQRQRTRDLAAGRTLTGPHRDEIAVTMAGKGQPAAECSTGEQKAMLIALVLAHSRLLEEAAAEAMHRPRLLLLDEVAAHLDPVRREALFDRLREGTAQVWLTGTELAPFEAILAEAAVWQVSDGVVERL